MSILDTIRDRELSKLERTERGKEYYADQVAQRADAVRSVLTGENQNPTVPLEVVAIRTVYYQFLSDYKQHYAPFPVKMTKQSIALWTRAEAARTRSGVPVKRFVRAQFAWFHDAFKKAPDPVQMTTDAAVERALVFQGATNRRVITNDIRHKPSLAETFKYNEKLLQQMMAAQKCSREEFYARFVVTGIYSFSQEFLDADPVYKKVKSG